MYTCVATRLLGERMARRKFVLVSACLVSSILAGSLGLGCGGGGNDCYGFKKSIVTVSLVEKYHEGTLFQNEDEPWPSGSQYAERLSESCGVDDVLSNLIRVEQKDAWSSYATCDRHFGTLIDQPDLDFITNGEREIYGLPPLLNEALSGSVLHSAGRGELFAGCSGWYTIMLHSGPQYYAGAIVPTDQIFDLPTPGLPPNWLVLRIFEPDEACDGLYLGDDPEITWCADTWVAKIDSIVPQ